MKKHLYLICFGFFLLQLQACDVKIKNNDSDTKANFVKKASRFANAKDYNCGMDTDDTYTDSSIYKGKVYGFCSATCKREFDKTPEKYAGK
jgi:YHS domain-containing protein